MINSLLHKKISIISNLDRSYQVEVNKYFDF